MANTFEDPIYILRFDRDYSAKLDGAESLMMKGSRARKRLKLLVLSRTTILTLALAMKPFPQSALLVVAYFLLSQHWLSYAFSTQWDRKVVQGNSWSSRVVTLIIQRLSSTVSVVSTHFATSKSTATRLLTRIHDVLTGNILAISDPLPSYWPRSQSAAVSLSLPKHSVYLPHRYSTPQTTDS